MQDPIRFGKSQSVTTSLRSGQKEIDPSILKRFRVGRPSLGIDCTVIPCDPYAIFEKFQDSVLENVECGQIVGEDYELALPSMLLEVASHDVHGHNDAGRLTP